MNSRQDNIDALYKKVYRHLVKKARCLRFSVNLFNNLEVVYNQYNTRAIGVDKMHFKYVVPVDFHQKSIIESDNYQDMHKTVVGLLLDAAKDGDICILGTGIRLLEKGSTLESIGIEVDLEG